MSQKNLFPIADRAKVHQRVQDLSRRSDDVKSRLAPTLKKLWLPARKLAVVGEFRKIGITKGLKMGE